MVEAKESHVSLNRPAPQALDLLLSRRSGSAKAMTGPGPSAGQLQTILAAGARVPDHGKLAPWRFIVLEGEARARLGEIAAARLPQVEADPSSERLEFERNRFLRAPTVAAVVSRVREGIPIPEWEQILSAGACCQNILIATHALGFVANWITEWPAYDAVVKEKLGLQSGERIAGFIYLGSPTVALEERVRPELNSLITRF
ncbi:MAG: nitroreductase [Proteobacteria bacterium]|nr:nitroreductase [Pseudomonadota bacterium]